MSRWSSQIRSAIIGMMSMCILNIGMVVWWAAKLDAIAANAITRAEIEIRDERIKNSNDAIKANKAELRRTNDKLERAIQQLSSNQ